MPYITREDGERFVIPSYRDVISAKKQSLLKREILLLSSNYGEYITLHRKNVDQYEVAFSPDTGYLLGETVWHYFKRPLDLIYCEALPNSTDVILVVVKSGSVYLDGSFPADSVPEELVIFRTQQNNFDIHIYGDVPISATVEDGKFSFDPSSVRSFDILAEPVFPKLPKVKNFQLQPVDSVLKSQGIGVLPVKQAIIIVVLLGLIWIIGTYVTTHKKELPTAIVGVVNPYQVYITTLTSPDPSNEIHHVYNAINLLYTMPGWDPISLEYNKGKFHVGVRSAGANTAILFAWAKANNLNIDIQPDGFYVSWMVPTTNRYAPQAIIKIEDLIGTVTDRLVTVLPGNHMAVSSIIDRKVYVETTVTINFDGLSPNIFSLIGLQLQNLPLVLNKVSIVFDNGKLTGSIVLQALGY